MVSGSCFCGQVRVECNELLTSALCHCTGCRKLTGTLYTYSFVVKTADLTVIGTPKEVAKTADSGNHIKNYFCSNCGTPLYGHKVKDTGEPEDITILRAGILDDVEILNQRKPQVEIYTENRIAWY
ncbi:hypothetical protein N8T08_000854 [Aspergillus melleus]|uniref:Uncharacterized protein n=1 Tax=Aspergillus melleus TaxID=138277 RepID=A0ACC3BAK4_9EURO|nr:hypothetical protein N8T08_000854 [Aspergillus melleus]